jgi:MarR family transcriptional regulator, organic hydroperoxide resistance regulator
MILTQPEHLNGITLKELTRAVGLSQSTVSGIVERLERAGLVQRKTDENDRRFTRIEASAGVKTYLQHELSTLRLGPLLKALEKASRDDRAAILKRFSDFKKVSGRKITC